MADTYTIKNYQINQLVSDDGTNKTWITLHPETDASNVIYNNSTVSTTISLLAQSIAAQGDSMVKNITSDDEAYLTVSSTGSQLEKIYTLTPQIKAVADATSTSTGLADAYAAKSYADSAAAKTVTAVATGDNNGTIKVTTNGTATNVSVKGLGSAAYTASTAYATAAQGTKADSAVQSITLGSASFVVSSGAATMTAANGRTALGLGSAATKDTTTTIAENTNLPTASAVKTYVDNAISGVTQFDYSVVESLPTTGVKGTIYLVADTHGTSDIYDEYIWVSDAWEKIGNTDIDLSNYVNTLSGTANSGVITNLTKTNGTLTVTSTSLTTSSPSVTGNTTSFIDTISQAANGKITATKKTIPNASTTTAGIMKVGTGLSASSGTVSVKLSSTTQTVAANTVSSTADRTYAVQPDSSGNLVVNVPWAGASNSVTTNDTLTGGTIVLGNGDKTIKTSSYSIIDVVGTGSYNIPTSNAVNSAITTALSSYATQTWVTNTATAHRAAGLSDSRTISSTGDVSWSVSFDGTSNATAAATLSATGVTAGTYTVVTVDTKGRATAGGNAFEIEVTSGTGPSTNLMIGGLFYKLI